MYVKIKESYFHLSLLITLAIVFVGYGFLGNLLYSYRTNNAGMALLFALSVAGIFALRLGFGGLIAATVGIAVLFFRAGVATGIVAAIVSLILLWFGLKSGESERLDANKAPTPLEWLTLVVTVILTITSTLAVLQVLSGVVAGVAVGLIAGAIAIVGNQVKESEISPKIGFGVLAIATGTGLIAGIVFGRLTQFDFPPS
jgi:hypothetical protein